MRALKRGELPARLDARHAAGTATTLAVVATDAVLTKAEANKVAQMAHDGLARSIHPVHTMGDGDVVFSLATGAARQPGSPTLVGALAADVLADAVLRAVRAAEGIGGNGLPDLPSAADLARTGHKKEEPGDST
jgi:L-aminopeptidase/D-esterase-like protein